MSQFKERKTVMKKLHSNSTHIQRITLKFIIVAFKKKKTNLVVK